MESLKKRLLDYVESLSGERPVLNERKTSSLPLFLRERYSVTSTSLFGKKTLLAIQGEDWDTGTPAEYEKHAELLGKSLGDTTVLVIPRLPSYARNRMVKMGTPFMVPGSQTFIPYCMLDLRERFPRSPAGRRKRFSPAAQCTVLYHLLREPITNLPLKEIAQRLNYSPMRLSRVKDELVIGKFCKAHKMGHAISLEFHNTGRDLWEEVLPQLSSPVTRLTWAYWEKPPQSAYVSGMSALSAQTSIQDDSLPTYALQDKKYLLATTLGGKKQPFDPEEATAKVEIWSYDPKLFENNGRVDSLSLYLSLRDTQDERVQQQLEKLIEGVPW